MPTKMIATASFKYGTRALQPKDEFEAENDEHAMVLTAANKARRSDGASPEVPPKRGRGRPKGSTYERRDMRAED
jgi:hypothetical protein